MILLHSKRTAGIFVEENSKSSSKFEKSVSINEIKNMIYLLLFRKKNSRTFLENLI